MPGNGDRARLLLVGAGHAHLEILRRLIEASAAPFVTTVVSLEERHFYSGMTPGYLADQYSFDDLTSDVPAIAERAGAECVIGRAVGLDPTDRIVRLESGDELSYDLVSFNIGSLLMGADSEAARHAERIKPLHRAERMKERLQGLAAEKGRGPVRVVVVGAGAAGVEVACAAAALLDRHDRARDVSILEAGDHILPGYSDRFRRRTREALDELGVACRTNRRAAAVEEDHVRLEDGETLPSDLSVWLTGPVATPFLAESGLPVDDLGFLWIDDGLRSVADERVFAVGDCGTLRDYPDTPKAGVYAVREAPVLWDNLIAAVRNESPTRYEPQSGFLSILNTCDGRALLRYKGFVSWSRWAWWLKDWIDRRFMVKYQRLAD